MHFNVKAVVDPYVVIYEIDIDSWVTLTKIYIFWALEPFLVEKNTYT